MDLIVARALLVADFINGIDINGIDSKRAFWAHWTAYGARYPKKRKPGGGARLLRTQLLCAPNL